LTSMHTILTSILEELLYLVPDEIREGEVLVDREYVLKQIGSIVQNRDLSHYIL